VVTLLAEGLANEEVAERLVVKPLDGEHAGEPALWSRPWRV